jgi:hypothetical protein
MRPCFNKRLSLARVAQLVEQLKIRVSGVQFPPCQMGGQLVSNEN